MLRLTEYEIADVRRLLDRIPVSIVEEDCSGFTDCAECGATVAYEYTKRVESVDPESAHRQYVADLVERIGEVYDVARARALRDAA
jgi:hypothetical protein